MEQEKPARKEKKEKTPYKEKADGAGKTGRPRIEHIDAGSIVRIASTDIPGHFNIYHGLTRIKGVSWSFSNAICLVLGMDRKRKISTLTESEIEKIIKFLEKPQLRPFLLNRRFDRISGENKHLITSNLELQREFDIRDMKKIRSYKGWRHATGQPVRGQRTRSHFRKGASLGVQRAKVKQPAKQPAEKGKAK